MCFTPIKTFCMTLIQSLDAQDRPPFGLKQF